MWKESCVALLEKFYNVNPYPDDTKREEIAAACNQLIDSTGQCPNPYAATKFKGLWKSDECFGKSLQIDI